MDIRNIKTAPPKVTNGAYLEKMFDLQKALMEGYIRIEGLPRYPLNINSKAAQVVLKDFASRAVEELAEGYESTHYAVQMMEKVGWNLDLLSDKEYSMLINHIQNSNEEQADASAFMLELLIYAGVTISDLREFAISQVQDEPDFKPEEVPTLELMMITGVKLLNSFNPIILEECPTDSAKYSLLSANRFKDTEEYLEVKSYCPGFCNISQAFHHHEMSYLWQIQYHLGVGRNYLKNKPWKQTGELSDEGPYYESLYLAVTKLFGYHLLMGLTPETLYNLFFKKNQVNVFRQKSHY